MRGWGQGWDELIGAAVQLRRALHRQPELAWEESQTAATVRAHLEHLRVPWRACAGTGTVATLASKASGRHIALRADLDALPIHEASGVAWASRRPGVMHACGHDGHTATLLATGAWLKRHEAQLPGPVTLIFQPAEEGGHGAREMIAGGALDGVEAIYGWHNWPSIPFGQARCPDGAVMSANGTFYIEVRGDGGHASEPERCRDPVLAAAALTVALQQVISRRTPPHEAAVVSVTSIEAPSTETIIPAVARLHGSVRAGSSLARERLFEQIQRVARGTADAHGVRAEVEFRPRYEATMNTPEVAGRFRKALRAQLGESWQAGQPPMPLLASEDFSYYLNKVPGAFALIGSDLGGEPSPPCHNPAYDFDDRLIPVVACLFTRLAGAPLPDTPLNNRGIHGPV